MSLFCFPKASACLLNSRSKVQEQRQPVPVQQTDGDPWVTHLVEESQTLGGDGALALGWDAVAVTGVAIQMHRVLELVEGVAVVEVVVTQGGTETEMLIDMTHECLPQEGMIPRLPEDQGDGETVTEAVAAAAVVVETDVPLLGQGVHQGGEAAMINSIFCAFHALFAYDIIFCIGVFQLPNPRGLLPLNLVSQQLSLMVQPAFVMTYSKNFQETLLVFSLART